MKLLMLKAINWYQLAREGRPSPCRFTPSCSQYAKEAVLTYGAGRGSWLATRRLIRCRPFGPSGFDPVPEPTVQAMQHDHEKCSSTNLIHPTGRVS